MLSTFLTLTHKSRFQRGQMLFPWLIWVCVNWWTQPVFNDLGLLESDWLVFNDLSLVEPDWSVFNVLGLVEPDWSVPTPFITQHNHKTAFALLGILTTYRMYEKQHQPPFKVFFLSVWVILLHPFFNILYESSFCSLVLPCRSVVWNAQIFSIVLCLFRNIVNSK